MMNSETLWSIAVPAPIWGGLTYAQGKLDWAVQPGQRVQVPLGNRKVHGIVLGPAQPSGHQIKPIHSVDDEAPCLPSVHMKWLQWLAEYYVYPIGLTMALAYPPLGRAKKRKTRSNPLEVPMGLATRAKHSLTPDQLKVKDAILNSPEQGTHLLHGVTGSGKTEVYLSLIEEQLQRGGKALMIVPEIALTPQLLERFTHWLGQDIAVLHSELTNRQKANEWWSVLDGEKSVVVGTRSALFCPIPNLKLVIVDEEHESSLKQDDRLKYHGRDAAVMLAHLSGCRCVLGSATPSIESWNNALTKKYFLHRLPCRVLNRSLPEIHLIDMRKKAKASIEGLPSWMSQELFEAMEVALDNGEQVALLLNRRGMATVVMCTDCGYVEQCEACEVNMTLHFGHHLVCHYCGHQRSKTERCPECHSTKVEALGLGTEKVAHELSHIFPNYKTVRVDRDEIQNRQDLEAFCALFYSGEAQILVGTQMIAKGLDFPKLTCVGILLADIGFNLPDLRATERSYQLLTQMAGRAGRHLTDGRRGQVLIQAYNTKHPSLQAAVFGSYQDFVTAEMEARQMLGFPPFGYIVCFRFEGPTQGLVEDVARSTQKSLTGALKNHSHSFLGPAPAPIMKLRGRFRYHLLLISPERLPVHRLVDAAVTEHRDVRTLVDVDPLHLL